MTNRSCGSAGGFLFVQQIFKRRHHDDADTSARLHRKAQWPAALLRSSWNRRAALVASWLLGLQPGLDSFSLAMGNEISAHSAGSARSWPLRHALETVPPRRRRL